MQLDAFWEEEKIIIQNLVPCSFHVKRVMFIVSQILPVNNPQQISVKVILITPRGSMRGNRQREKSWPQIPCESISAEQSSPESPAGLPNSNLLLNAAHTQTHTHTLKHKGFELQSACFGPVQTQIRPYSLGRVSGTHQAVCTAISSPLLSMFCPLSFQRDYGMLSSCRNINWGSGGNAKEACCFAPLITHSVIITCHNERCSLQLSWELIIILWQLSCPSKQVQYLK